MKVRIVSVPPGQAPEWVRKEWVGLELLVTIVSSPEEFEQTGVKFGKPENLGGYTIETTTALAILREKNPEAARWWDQNISPELMPYLVFKKEVCEPIE